VRLYHHVVDPSFTKSKAKTKTSTELTKALQRILWGVNWLQKLDKNLASILLILDESMEHINVRLAKASIAQSPPTPTLLEVLESGREQQRADNYQWFCRGGYTGMRPYVNANKIS
jgi:hypothetical protein